MVWCHGSDSDVILYDTHHICTGGRAVWGRYDVLEVPGLERTVASPCDDVPYCVRGGVLAPPHR